MDDFHQRAIKNLRERHESQITEEAERIRDHVGYVLKRIEGGRADSTGIYAAAIAASARRIELHAAALETLKDTLGILETSDGD